MDFSFSMDQKAVNIIRGDSFVYKISEEASLVFRDAL